MLLRTSKAAVAVAVALVAVLVASPSSSVTAFTVSSNGRVLLQRGTTQCNALKIPFENPFSESSPAIEEDSTSPLSFDKTNIESLVNRAKVLLSADLGIQDPSLLSPDFVFLGPEEDRLLTKEEYVAAGKFFDLRSTFPDLDYRAHDFRVDEGDTGGGTIRFTARVVGTMRNELKLRKETIPPNGKRMVCPPESISITFDEAGLVSKLCAGFTMDRQVGNTRGLCGVRAAAVIAGSPPSEFDLFPPYFVIQRFFSRTVRQLNDVDGAFMSPFPESVMIQLAKGIDAAKGGANDPDLLSNKFNFCAPYVGPLRKDEYLKGLAGFFEGSDGSTAFTLDKPSALSNFRVDPYDSYRVWADSNVKAKNTGNLMGKPATGETWISPPEAVSYTFDDEGYCTRFTAGYVMDPSIGNTGGLGGLFGAAYACKSPINFLVSRTISSVLTRLQRSLLEPITGISPDDYIKQSTQFPPVVDAVVPQPPKTPVPLNIEPPKVLTNPVPKPATEVKKPVGEKTVKVPRKKPLKEPAQENKESPTLSIFDFSSSDSKKVQTSVAPKKGPSPKPSKFTPKKPDIVAKKKSPSLSIFGAEQKSKTSAPQKTSQPISPKKSPSLSIFGGTNSSPSSKAVQPKKAQKPTAKKSPVQVKQTKKPVVKKVAVTPKAKKPDPPKKSPTLSIFGGVESKDISKPVTKKSPTLSIFGAAPSTPTKSDEKKSPTLSIFGAGKEKASPSIQATKPKITPKKPPSDVKKSPTLSIFGSLPKADAPKVASPKEEKKSPTLSIFGSNVNKPVADPIKAKVSPVKKKPVVSAEIKPPRGIPVFSNWRKNRDGSITGLITGSKSFNEGEKVTTSPIKGDIKSKTVVETISGSKYFLN